MKEREQPKTAAWYEAQSNQYGRLRKALWPLIRDIYPEGDSDYVKSVTDIFTDIATRLQEAERERDEAQKYSKLNYDDATRLSGQVEKEQARAEAAESRVVELEKEKHQALLALATEGTHYAMGAIERISPGWTKRIIKQEIAGSNNS